MHVAFEVSSPSARKNYNKFNTVYACKHYCVCVRNIIQSLCTNASSRYRSFQSTCRSWSVFVTVDGTSDVQKALSMAKVQQVISRQRNYLINYFTYKAVKHRRFCLQWCCYEFIIISSAFPLMELFISPFSSLKSDVWIHRKSAHKLETSLCAWEETSTANKSCLWKSFSLSRFEIEMKRIYDFAFASSVHTLRSFPALKLWNGK